MSKLSASNCPDCKSSDIEKTNLNMEGTSNFIDKKGLKF